MPSLRLYGPNPETGRSQPIQGIAAGRPRSPRGSAQGQVPAETARPAGRRWKTAGSAGLESPEESRRSWFRRLRLLERPRDYSFGSFKREKGTDPPQRERPVTHQGGSAVSAQGELRPARIAGDEPANERMKRAAALTPLEQTDRSRLVRRAVGR